MASPRGFEPPANSLGSYYINNRINDILVVCHIFCHISFKSTFYWCYNDPKSRIRVGVRQAAKQVKAIFQCVMRRLCGVFHTFRPSPVNAEVRPKAVACTDTATSGADAPRQLPFDRAAITVRIKLRSIRLHRLRTQVS